jgi:long-chain acyl-CoA synthetase
LERTRLLFGERAAFVGEGGRRTWQEHLGRVRRIAGALARLGIGRADRFGVIARNSERQAELFHAAYWRGAVAVPVNYRLAPPEISFVLDDADVSVVFAEAEFAALAGQRRVIVFEGGEADTREFERLVDGAESVDRSDNRPDDVALLLYTGGTTGRSKGVPLTHRNVLANATQLTHAMAPRNDDVFLHVAPMFHSADLLSTPYTLVGAAHTYLARFSGADALRAMARHGVSVSMLTPTMVVALLDARHSEAPSRFRHLFYGSSPFPPDRIRETALAFPGIDLQQGYGLTETSPILTTLDPAEHRAALAGGDTQLLRSVGRPLIGVDLRIADAAGRPVPPGEIGEIAVRGPNVMSGYHNRPDETREAIRGGWFHTGDLGTLDARGFLFLLDRKKDMIITGGENVYSVEVEAVLAGHPGIREVAIVGVPDPYYGEALLAVLVPNAGATLTVDAIQSFCRGKIGGYKIPRRMAIVESLPRSALGKVLKHELRNKFSVAT